MNHPREHVEAFVDTLSKEMLAFCGPIFITPGLLTYPDQMVDNGTYSLIYTGQKHLLVTCHHVWQKYLDCHSKNSNAVLAVNLGDGDASVAFARPDQLLIDADADLDLAVFDFQPTQIQVNKVKVNHQKDWFPIRQWPIPVVADKEHVALMGFPGKRIKKDGVVCTFRTQVLPLKISGVGQKQIFIFNEGENVEVFNDIKTWLGGLSGSPAYALGANGASLVGFVRSGYKEVEGQQTCGEDSLFSGTLALTHASFLRPDGTLVRP